MAHVVLVHGWNVADGGERTVDRLAPALEAAGHTVDTDEADYGFLTWQMFSFVSRRVMRTSIVERLNRAFSDADVVITHSNGAHFAHMALRYLDMVETARRRTLIHFSPALDRSTRRPLAANTMHVFHTRSDWAVRMASYLPFHPWGRMGAYGPTEGDPLAFAYDYTGVVKGHSDWFHEEHLGASARNSLRLIERYHS